MDHVRRIRRLVLFLALIAVIFVFGLEAANAQTPPTVWIQRGSGTGSGVDPTGSYACGTSKVFYIWLDNTQVTPPTTWNGTYYVVTFPKKFFTSTSNLIPKTSSSIATGHTITSDADNWYVRINLSAVGGTVKASIPFEITGHNCGVIPQGQEFTPKVEYFDSQGQALRVVEEFTNPENELGVLSEPYVFGNGGLYAQSTIQGTTAGDRTFYGGSAYTENGVSYINPATATSLRFTYRHYRNTNSRYFVKGKLEITLPTYPCKTGTCTAEFDAAQSPGWTQVGNKLVFNYDVRDQITPANQWNGGAIDTLINNALNNKPYYLKFPDATLSNANETGSITTRGDSVDLVPVNEAPTDPSRTTYATQRFRLTANLPNFVGKGPDNTTTYHETGYMHEKSYSWSITVGQGATASLPQPVDEILEHGLDSRLYIDRIVIGTPLGYNLESVTGVTAAGVSETIAFTPTTSPTGSVTISNLDPDAAAGVAAQVDLVENQGVTDYSTLPTNVRKYESFILKFKPGTEIPAGGSGTVSLTSRALNPYTMTYVAGGSGGGCTYTNNTVPAGSTNPNRICNYTQVSGANGVVRDTANYLLYGSIPYIYGYHQSLNGGSGSAISVGTQMRYYSYLGFCYFPRGYIHRGLTYTVLLPPGAEYYDTNPSDLTSPTGIYPSTSALRQYVKSKTVIPNFKGTGRTAVEIKFNDFKQVDVFGVVQECTRPYISLTFKVGPDAIPDSMETFYQQQYASQAGEIPSNLPNEIHAFWNLDNYTDIIRGTSPSNQGAYAVDENGDFVYGVGTGYLTRDHLDLNENGTPANPTTSSEDQIIHFTRTFKVVMPANLYASKFIFKGEDQPSRNDTSVPLNGDYTYRLQVDNKTQQAYSRVLFYDILPHVGDTMYASPGVTPAPRGTEFRGVLAGPMTGNATAKYDIHYCTKADPSNDPQVGIQDAAAGGCDWQTSVADWSAVTAVRMQLKAGESLGELESHYFDMPMKSPDIVTDWETSYDVSANAFAISYNDGQSFGESNLVKAIKNVAFPVRKRWVGGRNYPPVTVQLYQKIGSGDPTLVQGQELTLSLMNASPGDPNLWEGKFYDLPAVTSDGTKIEYSVKEKRPTNPEEDPLRYYTTTMNGSVPTSGDIPGYTIINTYTPPTIPVEATKIWQDGQTVRTPVQMTLYRRVAPEPVAMLPTFAFRGIPANQLLDEIVPESELKTIQGQTCLTTNPATFTPNTAATPGNATQTLTQQWCVAKFSNDGLEYIYTVKETSQPGTGWTVEYDDDDPLTVTNKYTPPLAPVTGTTVWVNGPVDPTTGKPEAYMQLYQQVGSGAQTPVADTQTDVSTPTAIGTPVTDTDGNQVWTVTKTWTDLPTADTMGRPISYSIKETDSGLTEITPPSYDKTQPELLKIVNTYRAPYVEIKATKNWNGGTQIQRPAFNVGIYIKEGDNLVRPENYSGTNKLPTPIFSTKPGATVTYQTAGVVNVPESAGAGVMTQDFYWYVPRTYNDGSPVTYYFEEMLGDGAAAEPLTSTAAPTGYTRTYQYDEAAAISTGETRTMAILNTYTPEMLKDNEKFVGKKEWSGGAEADRKDVTLVVWRKTEIGAAEQVDDATHSFDKLLAANAAATHSWTAEWDNVLPKTEQATGLPYTYWVDEAAVPDGWTRTNPVNNTMPTVEADRKIVRNVYIKPQGPVEASKTWVGGSTLTPPAVTFTLYRIADGMVDREVVPVAEIISGQAGFETTNPVTKTPTDNTAIALKWQTNLKNQDGKPYVFSIDEAPITNYEKTIDPANPLAITNTYKSPKITQTPEVKWIGGTIPDRETVTVTLYRKDPVTGTVTVAGTKELAASEAGTHNWQHTFTDLDEREQTTGQPYIYYADESPTTDQWIKVKSEADQTPITNNETLIITNKYVPKVGEVVGRKVWVNGANAEKTPITLQLYRKKPNTAFAPVGDQKTVTSDAPTATWQDMPEKDTDGLPFTYIVDETMNVYDVTQGKWVKVESDGVTETTALNDSLTVRNKFVTKTTSVTGDLTFVNGPAAKPAVTMHLYRVNSDGTRTEVGTAKDFPAGNSATLQNTWADMPQYDDTGTEITYEVDVVNEPDNYYRVEGMTGTEHTTANHDLSIHLRYRTPRTEVHVTKEWVYGSALLRPAVTLRLLQNGALYEGTGAPITIAATTTPGVTSDSSKSWTDLPLTDDNGTPYVYTVEEELAAGQPYTVAYNNTADPRVVTNTYVPPTFDVLGEVEWHGGPDAKEGVTVTLKRKTEGGTPTGIGPGEDHSFPPASYWTDSHSWTNLPKTDIDGNPYTYSLEHNGPNPTNYRVSQDPNNPLKVHYYYQQPMVELTGTKVWDGGAEPRPSVQLVLKRKLGAGAEENVPVSDLSTDTGFVAQNPVQITNGTTTVHWKTYDRSMNGEMYVFSIGEVTVPDSYEMTVDNTTLTVTNRFVPKDIEVKAVKNWDGGSNANSGVRPNVTFTISRTLNGNPDPVTGFVNEAGYATTETVTLPAPANGAEVKWKVPSAEQTTGAVYVYTVSEAPVPGYTTTITNSGNVWTAKNTYVIPTAKLTINVHWDGGRPPYPATSVDIKANGTTVQNVPFGSDSSTTYTRPDIELPLTDREGNPITYTISQPGVPTKYTETIEEPGGTQLDPNAPKTLNITNKYVPGRGDVNGYKTWVGGETVREDIWFKLYREDATGTLVEVSAADGGGIKRLTPTDVETIWTNVKIEGDDGIPYVFGVKEVNEDGTNEAWTPTDFVKTENGTTVTNTYVPPIIAELEGKKVWSPAATEHPDIWFELLRKVGENGTAEVVTDGNGVSRQQLVYPTITALWHDLPGRTNRGEPYTYFIHEVDADGADFTPDGFDKSETGMTVANARLSNLTVKLITTPLSDQLFKVTVVSDEDTRPEAQLNSDGEDVETPSTVLHEKMKLTVYRIQLPDINHEDWAVESIECKSRPLDSTGDFDTDVPIDAQLSLHGRLTGLFTIPDMPVEQDIYCTYKLRSLRIGQIVVKNLTYPNMNVNGGVLPTYHYGTAGTGFESFDLSTSDTPNSTEVTPGNYSVAQQNLEGWVTIDIIVTSSYPGRNPLRNRKDDPTGAYEFLNGGAIPAGYTGTGIDSIADIEVLGGEVVTVTYVNVPPNTVLLKKLTIPAGASERFPITGLFEGTIGHGEILIRTDVEPGTGQRGVVRELPYEGWTKHSVSCVEVGPVNETKSFGDLYTMEAWYGLDEGEVVMCTFVNRAYGAEEENPDINDPDIPGFTDKGIAGSGFYADGLPRTGFSPNRVTVLPEQTQAKMYQASELTLTIPKLDLSMKIAGVPQVEGAWDVSWLGTQAGYLMGTAYPTHAGNSVITAHVWDAYNNPGPFANLKTLGYGDRIEISAYGKTYVYEVRESKQVLETDVEKVTAAKDGTWVTLLTCEDYSEASGDYRHRRVVEAILIEVK